MWSTSLTVVTPSATSAGDHQAGAGPDVGGPHRRRRTAGPPAHHGVVPVGTDVRAQPDQLVDEHEPGVEDVLGDHGGTLGHGVQAEHHRLQVGREARVGQRGRRRPRSGRRSHRHPEAVRRPLRPRRPRVTSLSSAISRCSGWAPWTRHVAPGHRRAERPGAGDDPVGDRVVCSTGRSASTPSISSVERADARRSGHPSRSASGRCRRSPARARRCRSRWCPWPAPRPSAGSRWRRRWGSPARSLAPCRPPAGAVAITNPCSSATVAPIRTSPSTCMSSGRASRSRRRPGRATCASPAPGQQRPEHADRRRASGGPGRSRPRCPSCSGTSMATVDRPHGRAVTVQPSRRSTSAMISTSRMSGTRSQMTVSPRRQQGRGHQLERASSWRRPPRPRRPAARRRSPGTVPRAASVRARGPRRPDRPVGSQHGATSPASTPGPATTARRRSAT